MPQWVHDFAALLTITSVIVLPAVGFLFRMARMPANRGAARAWSKDASQPPPLYRQRVNWLDELRADIVYRIIRPDMPWTVDAYVIAGLALLLIAAAGVLIWGTAYDFGWIQIARDLLVWVMAGVAVWIVFLAALLLWKMRYRLNAGR